MTQNTLKNKGQNRPFSLWRAIKFMEAIRLPFEKGIEDWGMCCIRELKQIIEGRVAK